MRFDGRGDGVGAAGWVGIGALVVLVSGCIQAREKGRAVVDTEADDGLSTTSDTRLEVAPDGVDVGLDVPTGDGGPNDVSRRECGNRTCEPGETREGCAVDCGCGNGVCEVVETEITCAADCCGATICGDCNCDAACGETSSNCPRDCWACGDGVVSPGEIDCGCLLDACRCPSTGGAGCGDGCCMGYLCGETPDSCGRDCGTGCGNAVCEPGETPVTCAVDCTVGACGNGLCEAGSGEEPETCPADCAAACGNCVCEFGETYLNCPPDCGSCGDGVCSNCPVLDEIDRCPADCGVNERR